MRRTFNSFDSYWHVSLAFFVRQVGYLATCWVRSLESYPAHRPDNEVVAAGVHPTAVLNFSLVYCCDSMEKRLSIADRYRLVSSPRAFH